MPLIIPSRHSASKVSGGFRKLSSQTSSGSSKNKSSPSPGLKPQKSSDASSLESPGLHGAHGALSPVSSNGSLSAKQQRPPLTLTFRIESPPLVMYGSPEESTGALLSGLFELEVLQEQPIAMESVYIAVYQEMRAKRASSPGEGSSSPSSSSKKSPGDSTTTISGGCADCLNRTNELARWDVLSSETGLPKQKHGYPFSHLLPGSLPISTDNSVFSVKYILKAVAVPADKSKYPQNFATEQTLDISRAILPGPDKTSLRVFPPTGLSAEMLIPKVVFPNSTLSFELALTGVTSTVNHKVSHWKMRKINWKINENIKLVVKPCAAHDRGGKPDTDSPDKGKNDVQQDSRVVSSGEIKNGWKSDFSNTGRIELSSEISTFCKPKMTCHITDPNLGLDVSHTLVVELVIAEETAPHKSSRQSIPTGAARVLRMQFNLTITERSGLGIAWDDEVPPVYENIPLSPPQYDSVCNLPPLQTVHGNQIQTLPSIHPSGQFTPNTLVGGTPRSLAATPTFSPSPLSAPAPLNEDPPPL